MILSYQESGFGPGTPLVFLHAYPLSSAMWKYQLQGFAAGHRTIALDFRGYGESTQIPEAGFSVEQFSTDVQETLADAGINKAIIGGCSMGGYVAFELWRSNPELVKGMILCDTKAEADTDDARAKRLEQIDRVRSSGTGWLPSFVCDNLLAPETRHQQPALVRDVQSWAMQPSCETIIRTLEMLANRPDSTATLAEIDVPVIVMVGEMDNVTPLKNAETISEGIAGSRLDVIPGAGHLAPLENPLASNAAIRSFIADTDL